MTCYASSRAREAKANPSITARSMSPADESLAQFDDETLAKAVVGRQKVVYGTDDRIDVFQMVPGRDLDDVDSVVALFNAGEIVDNGNGTSTLSTQNFGTSNNLCAGEAFASQPVGAHCSGFLVGADLVATAGHCVNDGNVTNKRFVFGFRMRDAATAETVISNTEIYSGAAVVGRQEVGDGADWAVIRLDRPVTNHRIADIRRTGRIGDGQAVHVIGHPVGLPTKFAGGASVRDNSPAAFFVANLDTYGGNSGSPVFNSATHQVEGILVRGETDFVMQGSCNISLVCPSTGCRGEDVTRTTEFAQLVGVAPGSWVARHGLTNAQYQQAFDELVPQGFRLVNVSGYGVNGQDLYAAIWAVDGGPAFVARHGLTNAQYQQAFDEFVPQGFRLVEVSGYEVNGQDFYAAIWQQDGGPPFVARHGLTNAQYQQAFDELVPQGFRLVHVSGYGINGQDFYAAIWQQDGGPPFVARHGLTNAQYQQAFDEFVPQGFRLVHVSGYDLNGQDFYAAIWQQDGGPPFVARHGLNNAQYQQAFDELVPQGFRLVHVSGYEVNGQDHYAAIWEQR